MAEIAFLPRSALAGVRRPATQAGASGVTLTERQPARVVAVLARADSRTTLIERCQTSGLVLPEGPQRFVGRGYAAVWTGPRQWLVEMEAAEADRLGRVLAGLADHCSTVSLDDSRAILVIDGASAGATLAKIVGIDLHPRAFGEDAAAVTVAGSMSVIIWRIGSGFECAVPRSVAASFWDWLVSSAAEFGVAAPL